MACTWIDLVWKHANVDNYIKQTKIADDVCKKNVLASLRRIVAEYDAAVLYFEKGDVAVVRLSEFQFNKQLQKAVTQVYKQVCDIKCEVQAERLEVVLKSLLDLMMNSDMIKITEIEFE